MPPGLITHFRNMNPMLGEVQKNSNKKKRKEGMKLVFELEFP